MLRDTKAEARIKKELKLNVAMYQAQQHLLRRMDEETIKAMLYGEPFPPEPEPPAPKLDLIGQLLMNAAELLERDGWCQGKLVRELVVIEYNNLPSLTDFRPFTADTPIPEPTMSYKHTMKRRYCAVGAIEEVSHRISNDTRHAAGPGLLSQAMHRFREYLYYELGWHRSVEKWNDQAGRTSEQVITALRGAAVYSQ